MYQSPNQSPTKKNFLAINQGIKLQANIKNAMKMRKDWFRDQTKGLI